MPVACRAELVSRGRYGGIVASGWDVVPSEPTLFNTRLTVTVAEPARPWTEMIFENKQQRCRGQFNYRVRNYSSNQLVDFNQFAKTGFQYSMFAPDLYSTCIPLKLSPVMIRTRPYCTFSSKQRIKNMSIVFINLTQI